MNPHPYSISDLHNYIAQDVFPNGAKLHCKQCGRTIKISTNVCALYLRKGWPKCCEHTMELTNENRNLR